MLKKGLLLLLVLAVVSGCSTHAASRYSISADNVVALRELGSEKINLGPFTSSKPGQSQIMCRGVGPVKTPDGEAFSDFIRKALLDELLIADTYSPKSPTILTGNLDHINFDSNIGVWNLQLTIKSSNGRTMTVQEDYSYVTSFYGETACNQTAQALMPAVQNVVGKIVRSPVFTTLLSK